MSRTFATNGLTPERRKYQVVQTSTNRDVVGIKLGKNGKQFKFNKKSHDFYINDSVLAKEITDTHGQNGSQDVVVIPVEKNAEPDHVRTVGGGTNWADAWEAFEARRKDKDES